MTGRFLWGLLAQAATLTIAAPAQALSVLDTGTVRVGIDLSDGWQAHVAVAPTIHYRASGSQR